MSSTPIHAASASDTHSTPSTTASSPRVIDYDLLARLVIREGKPFKASALQVGYSVSVAENGLKKLMAESSMVADAVRREWDSISVSIDKLKPLAITRLYREIVDVDSPMGMKAIELAGRFRETDWFVRNADIQLGVFLGMAEQTPETPATKQDTFKE